MRPCFSLRLSLYFYTYSTLLHHMKNHLTGKLLPSWSLLNTMHLFIQEKMALRPTESPRTTLMTLSEIFAYLNCIQSSLHPGLRRWNLGMADVKWTRNKIFMLCYCEATYFKWTENMGSICQFYIVSLILQRCNITKNVSRSCYRLMKAWDNECHSNFTCPWINKCIVFSKVQIGRCFLCWWFFIWWRNVF